MDTFDVEKIKEMYPGAYEQLQPYIQETVGGYGAGRNLTEADVKRMTGEVLSKSHYQSQMPAGFHNMSLNEFVRLLVLINLYNNYGYNLNPFWQLYYGGIPFFILPFIKRGVPQQGNLPFMRRQRGRKRGRRLF